MDDAKIDEYLEKQGMAFKLKIIILMKNKTNNDTNKIYLGIRSMQDHGPKKPVIPKRKKVSSKKRTLKKPRDNEHLADVLETYEDNTITTQGANIKTN